MPSGSMPSGTAPLWLSMRSAPGLVQKVHCGPHAYSPRLLADESGMRKYQVGAAATIDVSQQLKHDMQPQLVCATGKWFAAGLHLLHADPAPTP